MKIKKSDKKKVNKRIVVVLKASEMGMRKRKPLH